MPIDAGDPDALVPEPPVEPEERRESPLITIFESPRETIRWVVATDPRRWVNALFFVSGFVGALSGLPSVFAWLEIELPVAAMVALAFGLGLVTILTAHANAWFMRWIGAMLGGDATREAVVAVSAYTSIPSTVGQALVLAVGIALYGTEPFRLTHPAMDGASPLLTRTLQLTDDLSWFWSVCLAIVGFAEVNRFSIGRSIAALLVALMIFLVTIAAMVVAAAIVVPALLDGSVVQ